MPSVRSAVKWLPLPVGVVLLAVAGYLGLQAKAKAARQVSYEASLRSYSTQVPLGATRTEVESYLRAKNIDFHPRGRGADYVKIGEERAPWYCGERYISIAFEYTPASQVLVKPSHADNNAETDILKHIRISEELGGCL